MAELWTTQECDGIVTARFRNPSMNYQTDEAIRQLTALIEVWGETDPRAVILAGDVPGKFISHFCPDEILSGIRDRTRIINRGPVRNAAVNRALNALADLRAPVIAALNGDAMGFGFELALACDIRVGEKGDYRYGLPELRLGILPGSGGTQRLSRLVGLGSALDIVLRARVFSPVEAHRLGLVTHLADDAVEYSLDIAREIAALPSLAVALAKRALHQGFDAPLVAALTIESDASVRAKLGPETDAVLAEYLAVPESDRKVWLEAGRRPLDQVLNSGSSNIGNVDHPGSHD